MSRWKRWQRDFHKKVKELEESPFTDEDDEKQFFEIELGLRLREHICPEAPYTEIWPLLSGYRFAGINARDDLFAMCMKAGQRIRFLLTAAAWEKEAARYMESTLAPYRLYALDLETKTVTRTRNGFWPERINIYDKLLQESAPYIKRSLSYAQADTEYTFVVNDIPRRITIPEAFTHKTSAPSLSIDHRREPLDISFDDLLQAATEMEAYNPSGKWVDRMSDLQKRLAQNVGGQLERSARSL
jgi:restriction endonuclease in pPIWI_RE module